MAFRRGSPQSWRRPGLNIFSEHNSEGWWDFLQGIDQKLKAAWPERLFRAQFRRLVGLFAGYRPKAEGCLELHFFGSSQRAAWGASRSVWKGSRRLSGRNVFSGYISKGWSGFSQRISPKPKTAWPERLFRAQFRTLERLFAQYRSKAGGCPELLFFGSSQRATGVVFRRGSTKSRRLSGLNVFSEHNSEGWWNFSQRISP